MSKFKSSLSLGSWLGGAVLALTIGLSAPANAQFAPTGAFSGVRDANLLSIVDVQARRPVRPQQRRVVRRGPSRGALTAGALVGAAIIGGALIANSHAAPRYPGLRPENNYFVDEYGRRVDAYGRPIDKYGRLIAAPAPVYRPAPQPQYYYEPAPQYYYQPQPRPRVHYVPQYERPVVERVRPRERGYSPQLVGPAADPYGRPYRRAPAGTPADMGHQYR